MEDAEKQLEAVAIFVLGDPKHYTNRYNTPHEVQFPVETNAPRECWFARQTTPGTLDGVGESASNITGPFTDPIMWKDPGEQV